MSSFFDQVYDEMSWIEVCSRLPGDLAARALKRRILNLDTLKLFVDAAGTQPAYVKDLKDHINQVITNSSVDDILSVFDENYHPRLFGWLNDSNAKRLREDGSDKLTTKFLFNLTEDNDLKGLTKVLNNILSAPNIDMGALVSVLRKADNSIFPTLCDSILKDSRPEIRVTPFGVGSTAFQLLTTNQQVICLKAFAKKEVNVNRVSMFDFKTLSLLKPLERLTVLDKYLGFFPNYCKLKIFSPMPSDEEVEFGLFAGCIEHNDLVNKINDKFNKVTKSDPPINSKNEDEEE